MNREEFTDRAWYAMWVLGILAIVISPVFLLRPVYAIVAWVILGVLFVLIADAGFIGWGKWYDRPIMRWRWWLRSGGDDYKHQRRGLSEEEQARDAIAGDIFGREMGWWD